jgi:hypothetical protein
MKRGTLLLRHTTGQMLPTFADAGLQELGFLRLLGAFLAPHSSKYAAAAPHFAALRRFVVGTPRLDPARDSGFRPFGAGFRPLQPS